MKQEKLLNAIGNIDEELLYGAMEEPALPSVKKSRSRLKWCVAAACLCVLITLPAAAANKELFVNVWQNFTDWEVRTSGKIAIKELAPELLELDGGYYPQENIEAAEEFLGITLPKSAALKEAEKAYFHIKFENGDSLTKHCYVDLGKDSEGRLLGINVEACYRYGNRYNKLPVTVSYGLTTELNSYDNGGGRGVTGMDDEENQPEQISYITPSGRECTIFYATYTGDKHVLCSGYGYMTMDNMLISVTIHHGSEKAVRSAMTQILDGFE